MTGPVPEIGARDARVQAIAELVREDLTEEAATGFPILRHIPSTGIIKLLDHITTLPPAQLGALLDAEARLAALHFFPAPLIARAHEELHTTDPAILRLGAAMQAPTFAYGLRYLGLRMHRQMINDPETVAQMAATRAKLDFRPRDDLPEQLVGATPIGDIQAAKAPLLRKLLNQLLIKRLSLKSSRRPGGELVYEGTIGGLPLRVSIIFSSRYAQLTYAITWSMRERGLSAQRLNYETLWGMNTGWDYLTEENAPRSIDLLEALLFRLVGICERVTALPALA